MTVLRTLALTARGLVGTDWVKLTAVVTDGGIVVGRITGETAKDGYAISPVLPTTWRTCGDIENAASKLDHNVNMSAVPMVGLRGTAAHRGHAKTAQPGSFTLDEIASKFGLDALTIEALKASYAEEAEAAA